MYEKEFVIYDDCHAVNGLLFMRYDLVFGTGGAEGA